MTALQSAPPANFKARLAKLSRSVGLLSGIVSICSVVGLYACIALARVDWPIDALTSFACYAVSVGVIGAVGSILARSWRLSVFALATAAIGASTVAREWGHGSVVDAGGPTLKVLAANVWTSNRNADAVRKAIQQESPDVIALLEVDNYWANAFPELDEDYPHRVVQPANDNFGIDVRSRLPLDEAGIVEICELATPSVQADVLLTDSSKVRLIVTHPLPPAGTTNWQRRNDQLTALASLAAASEHPLLIVGDLNVTPWSPFFVDLKRNGQLDDARLSGHGLSPTWNTQTGWIRVPIDHALTKNLDTIDYHVGPATGSDHYPICVTVSPRP